MFTRLMLIALLIPTLAAASSKTCNITVINNAERHSAAIGFTTPIKHSDKNLVAARSTSELTSSASKAMLYVYYFQPNQTEHNGEIIQPIMGHTIDCQAGKNVQVTITNTGDEPSMTVNYN